MRKSLQSIKTVSAGGSHVLLLTHPRGQLVSWGAGGYGQLGHGFLWDDSGPRFINNMSEVSDYLLTC
jgi:alpha-tubulin suppressor-like RCC1 family protein